MDEVEIRMFSWGECVRLACDSATHVPRAGRTNVVADGLRNVGSFLEARKGDVMVAEKCGHGVLACASLS